MSLEIKFQKYLVGGSRTFGSWLDILNDTEESVPWWGFATTEHLLFQKVEGERRLNLRIKVGGKACHTYTPIIYLHI